jgi:hypothetical protein
MNEARDVHGDRLFDAAQVQVFEPCKASPDSRIVYQDIGTCLKLENPIHKTLATLGV